MKTVIIIVFHPSECTEESRTNPGEHIRDPFDGVSLLAIEPASLGSDYEDIIGPVREQDPNALFMIQEV